MKGSLISLFLVHSVICEIQRRDANDAHQNEANSSDEYRETWKMGPINAVQNKTGDLTEREVELLERAYVRSLRWIIGDIISQLSPPSPEDLEGEKERRGNLESLRCIAIVADSFHEELFGVTFVQPKEMAEEESYGPFPSYVYRTSESEEAQEPDNETLAMLKGMSKEGCGLFLILMKDGESAGKFLRFGERYRELDTRAKFILIYDSRLLQLEFQYMWKEIINVIFLRPHVSSNIWFELLTVSFPRTDNITKLVDIWSRGVFRIGNSLTFEKGKRKENNLFPDKTNHLQGQTLKAFTFDHVPSAIKKDDGFIENSITGFHGIEIMILDTLAGFMNFRVRLIEVSNDERWGLVDENGNWTGLFGAVSRGEADIALGNLFYTPYFLEKFDLSIPYTVQCLTFLTPESRTDNSWATLILPFKASTWGAIISTLIAGGFLFRSIGTLQRSRKQHERSSKKSRKRRDSNKVAYPFARLDDAILYSWGMLLQVPLPAFPSSWPLRLLSGCWWLFCLLVAVAYRSSMTAVLSSPPPRLVYDTLSDLEASGFSPGGWGEEPKQFFSTALDAPSRRLAKRFETLGGDEASPQRVAGRVAGGHFAFYENEYWLRDARARFLRGDGRNGTTTGPYSLHVMRECAIRMPISLGLRQNSPLKTRVDHLLGRMVEAGLIGRWLKETMKPTLLAERNQAVQNSADERDGEGSSRDNSEGNNESKKALMNLRKMYGALFALGLGYLIGFLVLLSEIAYHRRLGKKNIGIGPWIHKKIQIDGF